MKATLKHLIPSFIRRHFKAQFDPIYREQLSREMEIDRLIKMPRFVAGETNLFEHPIYFRDSCTLVADYREIYQRQIYRFMPSRSESVILDCGANIGISTLFFRTNYPSAKIIAFEPDPSIFEILYENMRNFNCSDIVLHQKAVADFSGEIPFLSEGGHSGRVPKPGDIGEQIHVACTRLKDFLQEPIEFLKLDIEGGEHKVLEDCADRLNMVQHLFVEYHSHHEEPQTLDRILELLRSAGFRYHISNAFVRQQPFVERHTMLGMDLQLNIFAYR